MVHVLLRCVYQSFCPIVSRYYSRSCCNVRRCDIERENKKTEIVQNIIIDDENLFESKNEMRNYLDGNKKPYQFVLLVERKCNFDKVEYLNKVICQLEAKYKNNRVVIFYFLAEEKNINVKVSKILGFSDKFCERIISKMIPSFQENKFASGIINGIELIDSELNKFS